MRCWKSSKGFLLLAAWGLALLLLAGCGSSSDTGDMTVPQLSYDGAGAVTTTRTRYLSGSVEAGATVEVIVGTTNVAANTVHVAGTRWSCTVDTLQAGSNLITVTASDAAGNQNVLQFYLTYDAVSIENYVSPISTGAETIGGLFDPSLGIPQVQVGSADAQAAVVDQVFPDRWSFPLTGLAAGNNTVKASVTLDGTAVPQTLTINVDSNAPTLTIDPVASPTVAADQTLTVNWAGVTAPVVSVPTVTSPTVTAGTAAGTWSVDLPKLGAGKNAVAVSATANNVTATAHTLIDQQVFTDRSPYAGQYDVDPGTTVSLTFSEDMNGTTLADTSFFLSTDGTNNTALLGSINYDDATRTATLTPDAPLAAATDYTVTVTTDVQTASGLALAHPVKWTFTTK